MSDYATPSMDVDYAIVQETNNSLTSMVSDFRDINDMLLEQQRLAQDQQVGLDATESNLQDAGDSLDTGVEELTQARNLRRGCCGCCGVPPCCKSCLGDTCCAKCTIQ